MIRKFIFIAVCISSQFTKASNLCLQEAKRERDEISADAESQRFIASKQELFQKIVLGRHWHIEMETHDCSPNGRFVLFESVLVDVKAFPQNSSIALAVQNEHLCASAFSSDSKMLVTASMNNCGICRLDLWDLSNFPHIEKHALLTPKERVISLRFKPHSQSLLIHREKGTISMLDFYVKDGQGVAFEKPLPTIKYNSVSLAEFNHGGTVLVLGYNNGELQLFDLTKDEPEIFELTRSRHASRVSSIVFSLDDRMIMTTAEEVSLDDGEDYIAPTFAWNTRQPQPLSPIEFSTALMPAALPKTNGRPKLAINYQGELTLWDILHLPAGMQAQLTCLTSSNYLSDRIVEMPFKKPRLSDVICLTELVCTKKTEDDGEDDELYTTRLNSLPASLKAVTQMLVRRNRNSGGFLPH